MGVKVIKDKKAIDYTFIHDNLNLKEPGEKKRSGGKKEKTVRDFRLRDDRAITKLKKSKISGGHGLQGHSPVYE